MRLFWRLFCTARGHQWTWSITLAEFGGGGFILHAGESMTFEMAPAVNPSKEWWCKRCGKRGKTEDVNNDDLIF